MFKKSISWGQTERMALTRFHGNPAPAHGLCLRFGWPDPARKRTV